MLTSCKVTQCHNLEHYNLNFSHCDHTISREMYYIYFKLLLLLLLRTSHIICVSCWQNIDIQNFFWYENPSSYKCFWISAFRTFSLSEHSGVMSASTEANGSVVCLSLTHYLQPNSGASIKVLMENEYNEMTVVGTATAPHGDIQVMTPLFYIR